MAKVVLLKAHFMFLRALVEEFIEVDDGETPKEVMDLAEEVKVLLSYTKHLRQFTIEIDNDSDQSQTPAGQA